MFRLLVSTTLISTIIISPTFAAPVRNMPHIVITATRTPVEKDKVGSAISVITREEIEESGKSQLFDLIKETPGVSFTRNGGAGSTSTVQLRGSNPGQVRVMVDGIFMNDPSGANTEFDFNSLLVNEIKRVEILRGPQSALYGSDAMGGVINIITKRGHGAPTFTGLVEGGSYQTKRTAAGVSGSEGDFNYSLQAQHFRTQGFSRFYLGTEEDGAKNNSVNGSAGYKINEALQLDVSGNWSHLESDYDASTADRANVQKKETRAGRAALTLETFDGIWEHIASVQAAGTKRDFDEPTSVSTRFSTFDGRQITGEYQSNVKLRKRDIFTAGLSREMQDANNNATNNVGVTTTNVNSDVTIDSLYGQYMLGLTDTTTITLGGRRDDHSEFGTENTYRVTAAQQVPATNTTLRGSYGTGFKAPTLFQLFHPTFGNPTLQPETSKGYDFGFDQNFMNNHLQISTTAFHNEYENLIEFDFVTSGYLNVSEATTKGIENSITFQATPELSFYTNYTYLLAEDGSSTRDLRRRPKHSFTSGANYRVEDKWGVGVDVNVVSKRPESTTGARTYVSGYSTVDLHGDVALSEQITAYARLENLFDHNYQEANRYQAAGRSVYMGLKATY